jgi:hypothetical protein
LQIHNYIFSGSPGTFPHKRQIFSNVPHSSQCSNHLIRPPTWSHLRTGETSPLFIISTRMARRPSPPPLLPRAIQTKAKVTTIPVFYLFITDKLYPGLENLRLLNVPTPSLDEPGMGAINVSSIHIPHPEDFVTPPLENRTGQHTFYVVTVGRSVGIFRTWYVSSLKVQAQPVNH